MKQTKWIPGHPTLHAEPSDRSRDDVARGLTPERLDAVMRTADSGDPRDQARLAREILERDWSVFDAVQTRSLALTGTRWRVTPGAETPEAERAADALRAQLEGAGMPDGEGTFQDLLECLQGALLPGYAAAEIVWGAGGRIRAFLPVPQELVMFPDTLEPRLELSGRPQGAPLDMRRMVFHRMAVHGHDPVRGGLIRPLAWLYVFANINIKDCLAFVERHGMPFITAKVNANAWERERSALKRLVRNFGPAGGGVFTDNVELQLLETQSTGDVYFRLLQYLDDAVHKVVLGQTATSGDAAGLSKGDAQSRVRQDILEADCARVAACVNAQVTRRWARFNLPPGTPAPVFGFDCEAPEDTAALAQTLASLRQAGLEADPEEMAKRFGFALTRAPQQPAQAAFPFDAERTPAEPPAGKPARGEKPRLASRLDALLDDSLSDGEWARRLDAVIQGGEALDTHALADAIASRARDAFAAAAAAEARKMG